MFKKLVVGILALVVVIAAFIGWRFFTSNTAFSTPSKYLYIYTDHAAYPDVLKTLQDSNFIKNPGSFDMLAKRMGLPESIKPGRYEIKKGMSLVDLVRHLRNGTQSPVSVTFNKIRLKEDLARIFGNKLECDSAALMQYMNNPQALQPYGLDTNTIMTMVWPNTYLYFWNSDPEKVFEKLYAESKKVWTPERLQQAADHDITPEQAYILASIIEEETRITEDKGKMASVYLNRIRKGQRLEADPTVKFALKNFALTRIYLKHLAVESPYNTYRNAGLPPGPICTPTLVTLDAVLQSPKTDYLYFVAKSDFSGRHEFSETYSQHLKYRRAFQKAQDERAREKQKAKEDTGSQQ